MVPTDNSKWSVLRELALAHFPEGAEVADTMRRVKELAIQQPGDAAVATEELAEEATAEAAAQEEMARDRHRWGADMAAARRAREVHELAIQRPHRRNLARRQAHRASQAGGKGSNTVDLD
jgi:hypothetical protein